MFAKGPIQDYGKEERGEESQDERTNTDEDYDQSTTSEFEVQYRECCEEDGFRVLQLGLMRDLRVSWRWENSGSHGAALATSRRTKRRVPHGH